MLEFDLQIFAFRSDCSANCATTTAQRVLIPITSAGPESGHSLETGFKPVLKQVFRADFLLLLPQISILLLFHLIQTKKSWVPFPTRRREKNGWLALNVNDSSNPSVCHITSFYLNPPPLCFFC